MGANQKGVPNTGTAPVTPARGHHRTAPSAGTPFQKCGLGAASMVKNPKIQVAVLREAAIVSIILHPVFDASRLLSGYYLRDWR